MGLRGDMAIELARGSTKVELLADQTVSNPHMSEPAFVWTGSELTIGEVSDIRLFGIEQLFEVVLDDNSTVQVSASSKFMMKRSMFPCRPSCELGESHPFMCPKEGSPNGVRSSSVWTITGW